MPVHKLLAAGRHPLVLLAVGFGPFLYLLLPAGIVTTNDDFGYFGSIIETMQRGRPWTDNWLEPWAASLSAFSCVVCSLTGSFQFSIHGLQAIYAAAAAAGAYQLLREHELSPRACCAVALLVVTFPTLLWKTVEYTSLVLYLPCFFWAVWAAGRQRWGTFFIAWLIAISSRQSALAWLALPLAVACVGRFSRSSRNSDWLRPTLALAGALLTFAALIWLMNRTQSQIMMSQHFWERLEIAKSLRNLAYGLGVSVVFTGIGAWVFCGRAGGLPATRWQTWAPLGMLAVGPTVLVLFIRLPHMFAEHASFLGWTGQAYAYLILTAGLAGWIFRSFTFRLDLLLTGLAALVLVGLRNEVWDYYYADIALCAFFGVKPTHRDPATASPRRRSAAVGMAALLLIAAFHLIFAFEQKCRVDRDYATCVISEKALRNGSLDVAELRYAPFGFIGWHLHPHFVLTDGRSDPNIGAFMNYLSSNAVELRQSELYLRPKLPPSLFAEGQEETSVLGNGVFRVGWLWHQRFTLVRANQAGIVPAALKFDRSTYQFRRFPITEQEWLDACGMAAP